MIMSRRKFIAAAMCAFAFEGSAQAETKKKKTVRKLPKNIGGTVGGLGSTIALTAGECTALGGTVITGGDICNSNQYCGTTDQNGVRHRVCIEAAAQ